jgi:hypothetical protein
MTRLSKFITVLALVLTLGGHWALLQSAAWVSMFVSNAQHDSWQLALNKTFDGQHPCALCHAVAQGQQAEHQQPQGFTVEKFELFLAEPEVFAFLEPSVSPLPPPEAIGLGRAEQPPTPPPRAFLSACLKGRPAVASAEPQRRWQCDPAKRLGGSLALPVDDLSSTLLVAATQSTWGWLRKPHWLAFPLNALPVPAWPLSLPGRGGVGVSPITFSAIPRYTSLRRWGRMCFVKGV